MKIAFVTYEYPPETGGGGIGTSAQQTAELFSKKGHSVEVFAGSEISNSTTKEGCIIVNRIKVEERKDFASAVVDIFERRNREIAFDIIEGPEYKADAREVATKFSTIPLVVKLRTPSFMVSEINYVEPSLSLKIRRFIGAIRRGNIPRFFKRPIYDPDFDIERLHTLSADAVIAPSKAIGETLVKRWGLNKEKLFYCPHPYTPSRKLLDIPVETNTKRVTFLGRLEVRKGVLALTKAIPHVLKENPNVKFRFIGNSSPSPDPRMNMKDYLKRKLKKYLASVEFLGEISLKQLPYYLGDTDICIFPSLWESFGMVVLEALSAGRGVVASKNGGMSEILEDGKYGELIDPKKPKEIADALSVLIKNPSERMAKGAAGREHVLRDYAEETIYAKQIKCYESALKEKSDK